MSRGRDWRGCRGRRSCLERLLQSTGADWQGDDAAVGPLRQDAGPLRQDAAPLRQDAAPLRQDAAPLRQEDAESPRRALRQEDAESPRRALRQDAEASRRALRQEDAESPRRALRQDAEASLRHRSEGVAEELRRRRDVVFSLTTIRVAEFRLPHGAEVTLNRVRGVVLMVVMTVAIAIHLTTKPDITVTPTNNQALTMEDSNHSSRLTDTVATLTNQTAAEWERAQRWPSPGWVVSPLARVARTWSAAT